MAVVSFPVSAKAARRTLASPSNASITMRRVWSRCSRARNRRNSTRSSSAPNAAPPSTETASATHSEAPGSAWLVGSLFAGYLLFKRRSPRYAIALTLLLGVVLWLGLGWGQGAAPAAGEIAPALSLTRPIWTSPEWSLSAVLSTGLPLAILCLTGQQLPGMAVLRAAGYSADSGKLVTGTSLASLLLAPFGSHGVNLAAITAAICTGEEAHPEPGRRWVAGVACGAFYLLIGSFAGSLTHSFSHLPTALVSTVAGLALMGAILGGLVNALGEPADREAALVTFVVTASNISLLGLGSACWGLGLGLLTWAVLRPTR